MTLSNMEAVDLVDKLMIQFRNNVRPSNADLVAAYKANINVNELERYIKEVELGTEQEVEEQYGEDGY